MQQANEQLKNLAQANKRQTLHDMRAGSAGGSDDTAHPIYMDIAIIATWIRDMIAKLFSLGFYDTVSSDFGRQTALSVRGIANDTLVRTSGKGIESAKNHTLT